MKVTIIETNENTELSIIDSKTSCDWTNDLLANHGELPDYNEETDSYHMTQESFDWWYDLMQRMEESEEILIEFKKTLNHEQLEEFEGQLQDALNCDLENQPEAIIQLCQEFNKK